MNRVVCLNCMDGRTQLPVIHWIKDTYGAKNVDMITEPGIDGILSTDGNVENIYKKINISLEKNDAAMIFVVGHHDCKGNPVSDEEHINHVKRSVERLSNDFSGKEIVGIWVNQDFQAEKIT